MLGGDSKGKTNLPSQQEKTHALGGFKKALQKHLNAIRVPFLGDLVQNLVICPVVTLTFGL